MRDLGRVPKSPLRDLALYGRGTGHTSGEGRIAGSPQQDLPAGQTRRRGLPHDWLLGAWTHFPLPCAPDGDGPFFGPKLSWVEKGLWFKVHTHCAGFRHCGGPGGWGASLSRRGSDSLSYLHGWPCPFPLPPQSHLLLLLSPWQRAWQEATGRSAEGEKPLGVWVGEGGTKEKAILRVAVVCA